MRAALTKELKDSHAEVTGFMLLKIDLPDTYEEAIVRTQVTKQEKITFQTRREVYEVEQQTENFKQKALADISIINSKA